MARKNKISDTINKPTPIFIPLCTAKVWLPKYVASLIISLNHKDFEYIIEAKELKKKINIKENPCNDITPVVVTANKEILLNKGQGDGDTKW